MNTKYRINFSAKYQKNHKLDYLTTKYKQQGVQLSRYEHSSWGRTWNNVITYQNSKPVATERCILNPWIEVNGPNVRGKMYISTNFHWHRKVWDSNGYWLHMHLYLLVNMLISVTMFPRDKQNVHGVKSKPKLLTSMQEALLHFHGLF